MRVGHIHLHRTAVASVRVLGGDTECPLQVCQLNRSSERVLTFLALGETELHEIPPEPRMTSENGGTCLRSIS